MTRAELEEYRAIREEIEQIRREIPHRCDGGTTAGHTAGSLPDFPSAKRTMEISGLAREAQKMIEALEMRLSDKIARRIRARDRMETFFDSLDIETAVILRGKYVENRTWRQIAQKLGKSEAGIKMRVHRFFTS